MSEQPDPSKGKVYPDRYKVERYGTADPAASRYAVLDPVHDFTARTALVVWANGLRSSGRTAAADAVLAFLDDTKEAHREFFRRKNEQEAKIAKRRGASAAKPMS